LPTGKITTSPFPTQSALIQPTDKNIVKHLKRDITFATVQTVVEY